MLLKSLRIEKHNRTSRWPCCQTERETFSALWIEQTEGAKFGLKVITDLKHAGVATSRDLQRADRRRRAHALVEFARGPWGYWKLAMGQFAILYPDRSAGEHVPHH